MLSSGMRASLVLVSFTSNPSSVISAVIRVFAISALPGRQQIAKCSGPRASEVVRLNCAHTVIAYNSCRNRHCPKCQGAAAKEWLAEREAELLPVGYFHLVFTLPGPMLILPTTTKPRSTVCCLRRRLRPR